MEHAGSLAQAGTVGGRELRGWPSDRKGRVGGTLVSFG